MRGCDGRFRSTTRLRQCPAEAEAQLGSRRWYSAGTVYSTAQGVSPRNAKASMLRQPSCQSNNKGLVLSDSTVQRKYTSYSRISFVKIRKLMVLTCSSCLTFYDHPHLTSHTLPAHWSAPQSRFASFLRKKGRGKREHKTILHRETLFLKSTSWLFCFSSLGAPVPWVSDCDYTTSSPTGMAG